MSGTDRIDRAKLRLLKAQVELLEAELEVISGGPVRSPALPSVHILDTSPKGLQALGALILGALNSARSGNPPTPATKAR